MAKTTTTQAYDPDKVYEVKLKRAVEIHPRVWARPSSTEVRLTGAVLNKLTADDIDTASEVDQAN